MVSNPFSKKLIKLMSLTILPCLLSLSCRNATNNGSSEKEVVGPESSKPPAFTVSKQIEFDSDFKSTIDVALGDSSIFCAAWGTMTQSFKKQVGLYLAKKELGCESEGKVLAASSVLLLENVAGITHLKYQDKTVGKIWAVSDSEGVGHRIESLCTLGQDSVCRLDLNGARPKIIFTK